MRRRAVPPVDRAMVSAAGNSSPVFVSPVVVSAGSAAVPAERVVTPLTATAVSVPTLVRLDAVTPLASVAPLNVPAAAVTVIAAVPSKLTPLIARAVASAVAVAALPVVLPLLPVMLPVMGAVTVSAAKVPTLVSDDAVTPAASVAPLKVPAAAVTVIGAVPSKLTPLMARVVASAVAVEALPVKAPKNAVDVTEVSPAIVVDVAPNAVEVEPIVIVELVNLAFDIEPANIASVTTPDAIVVALPTEVTLPVRLALVVTLLAVNEVAVPVIFVPTKALGVSSAGVTNVGLVANTNAPEPVSSVTAAAKFALLGVAKKVAIPVPSPEIPVPTGSPVTLVMTPDAGVPRAGAVIVGLVNVLLVRVCVRVNVTNSTSAAANPAFQTSAVSSQINEAFVDVPRSISIPAFCEGVPASSLFKTRMLSPIDTVLELIVVVVPLTIKSPLRVTLAALTVPVNVGLPANTAAPEPVSSVNAAASCADVNEPSTAAFPTEVTCPVKLAFVVTVVALPVMLLANVPVVASYTNAVVDFGVWLLPLAFTITGNNEVLVVSTVVLIAVDGPWTP